jgi:hypothetical protein
MWQLGRWTWNMLPCIQAQHLMQPALNRVTWRIPEEGEGTTQKTFINVAALSKQ